MNLFHRLTGIKKEGVIMNNFGFISKKKVAREIAKINNKYSGKWLTREDFHFNEGVCNGMNVLCSALKIKPMHRNKLGGGTGEMLCGEVKKDG